jgi:hypothetical protein
MHDKIIKETGTPRGRGVFAIRDFKAGELIEACPAIIISNVLYKDQPEELKRIVFDWGNLSGAMDTKTAIALGYGSLYNNANPANMCYQADVSSTMLIFVAVCDLQAGEELTINYSGVCGNNESPNNKWFDELDIEPL